MTVSQDRQKADFWYGGYNSLLKSHVTLHGAYSVSHAAITT